MLAVVCDDHKNIMEDRLVRMQEAKKIPSGKINFVQMKAVTTDCIVGLEDDYVEQELQRGINSDRKV
jgi:hypothetical protein